jgi:hypothetical protein
MADGRKPIAGTRAQGPIERSLTPRGSGLDRTDPSGHNMQVKPAQQQDVASAAECPESDETAVELDQDTLEDLRGLKPSHSR